MPYRISESPSGRTRHWEKRRKGSFSAPWFARPLLIIISFILIATLTFQGVRYAWRSRHLARDAAATRAGSAPAASASVWQRDVIVSLDEAVRHASEVDLAPTEMSLDHAASILTLARAKSQPASPDFFDVTARKLDDVLAAYHTNSRLTEHITLARIELAELRSSLEPLPPGTPESIQGDEILVEAATGGPSHTSAPTPDSTVGARQAVPERDARHDAAHPPGSSSGVSVPGTAKHMGGAPPGHVIILAPHSLDTGALLDPAALGGDFIDATGMPSRSEILEPPASRLFTDNVRVENMSIAGAAQTLDGIHWKNVTFVGTRLRYEGGELDLHNVRFVRCLFGFTTDDRGGRLATAIARGQTTVVIE